jgi:hypothetical protein
MTDPYINGMDPPNWAIAESHGKAVSIGIPKHKHWRRAN